MRLKPEKIEQLAELVRQTLAENDEVEFVGTPEEIEKIIHDEIEKDLKAEDEIEEEARTLLEAHEDDVRRTGANPMTLLRKAKEKLARDRKMIL